ncbi:MAG: hypothetical protein RIR26_1281 [Pseudomonadota bacterium]
MGSLNSLTRLKSPTRLKFASGIFSVLGAAVALTVFNVSAAELQVKPSDLAIILPAQKDLRIAAGDTVGPQRDSFLPRKLVTQVEDAFRSTSVGDAVAVENSYPDWTLVSARIVPCSPLGLIPGTEAQVLCWPEVRLVWQPVIGEFRRYATVLKWFADDRAIHALYDFPAQLLPSAAQAGRAETLLSKVRSALAKKPADGSSLLSSAELGEFIALRNAASAILMQKALALRSVQVPPQEFEKLDERPEFQSPEEAAQLITRLKSFLSETTPFASLKELTSFSLPEGREPPQADEWVFLKFLKQQGKMVQVDITLHSAHDGRELFNLGPAPKASQMRDAPELHTALDTMNARDAAEIRERVLLSPSEVSQKKSVINDRSQGLVPNTTCGSCHKFNSLRFDFHNLSYLEDRTVSISPRVRFDIQRDLEWLSASDNH